MFERVIIGPTGSDCTAPYNVKLDRDYTLNEFLGEILRQHPDEWGEFRIFIEGKQGICASVDYKYGRVKGRIPFELLDMPVKSSSAHGGWSSMDYVIRIGGVN